MQDRTCQKLPRPASVKGFTLLEVVVAMAILAVLAAIAAPAMTTMIDRMRVSTVADELVASIHLTRTEAIQRNGFVTMARIDGTACSLNKSQNWSCGWEIFNDVNNNGTRNATEPLLHTVAVTQGITVTSPGGAKLKGNRWGQLDGLNAVRFVIAPTSAGVGSEATRTVCVNSGGRVRIVEGSVCP